MEPSLTTRAGHPQRSDTSRSVAEMRTSPPRASARTLERIGMEFFLSTMPWTRCNSRTRSLFWTMISMASYLQVSLFEKTLITA
jgi:hypothetical protein